MAAVALMMIIIQILCVYIPTSAFTMIRADFDNKKIELAGSMDEVGTECVIILRQILNRNKETWGVLGAQGVLLNILTLTLSPQVDQYNIKPEWVSKEPNPAQAMFKAMQQMGGMNFDQSTIDKMTEAGEEYPVTSEQLDSVMEKESES